MFYVEDDLEDLYYTNLKKYNYISKYTHGYCDTWVCKHYKKTDTIIALVQYDYDIEHMALVHAWLFRNNQHTDARGNTDDLDLFLEEFSDLMNGEDELVEFNHLTDFKKYLKDVLGIQ